jgi:uncharacterized membrane protein YfcA
VIGLALDLLPAWRTPGYTQWTYPRPAHRLPVQNVIRPSSDRPTPPRTHRLSCTLFLSSPFPSNGPPDAMDIADGNFLGMIGINVWVFTGLSVAALGAAFIAAIVGTAGGLILIAVMAFVFPPALLIPLHTVVQLGAATSMAISRWRYLMSDMVLPFTVGTAIGAAIGGRIFVSLPENVLLLALGISILALAWVPKIAQFGPERGRFVFVGFVVTFLGVFISATGTLLSAFTAAVAPGRRNHIATLGVLMTIVHLAKLAAFGLLGVSFGSYGPLIAAMIVTSFIGTYIGKYALDRIPERLFRIGIQTMLTLLSIRLIWIAMEGFSVAADT